jgi:hypothetical protein
MKHFKMIAISILIAALGLLIPLPGSAADETGSKAGASSDTKVQGTEAPKKLPTYTPPLRGTPGGRVAGGTRGESDGFPTVLALVPDHTGLTTQEQPSLYWFLSQPANCSIEFSIIEDKTERPLVEARIGNVVQPGVQCVRLADYGARLKNGVAYQWYVALVTDPNQRSKDIIAGGEIERIDLQGDVRSKLDKAGKTNAPLVYAEAGIWYDAMAAVSELIAAAPDNAAVRSQRVSLLEQVGLTEVVEYEMKRK